MAGNEKRVNHRAVHSVAPLYNHGTPKGPTLALLLCLLCLELSGGCRRQAAPATGGNTATGSTTITISAVEERARLAADARMNPDDPQAALKLALFDDAAGHTEEAERALIALNRKFPRFADGPFQLGSLYLNDGHNEASISVLKQAAKLAPDRYDVLVMAGLASFRLLRYGEAQQYVSQAIRLNPEAPAAYLLQARIYSSTGTAERAMPALHAYLIRAKEPEPGYYLLGRLYYRQADPVNAERWLKKAIAARGDNPDTWAILGHVYSELDNGKRIEDGIKCYLNALALRSNDWETHAAAGRALMQTRRWEDAITHLRIAVQTAPDSGPLLYTLGQALLRGGHADEGKQRLTEYQAYRDYTSGLAKLTRAAKQAPQDRFRQYALARYCLSYRQFDAAETVITETEHKFGPDETSRQLQARIAGGRAAKSSRTP